MYVKSSANKGVNVVKYICIPITNITINTKLILFFFIKRPFFPGDNQAKFTQTISFLQLERNISKTKDSTCKPSFTVYTARGVGRTVRSKT